MRIVTHDGLPFVTATLVHGGRAVEIPDVLLDTGSGGTVFSTDLVATIQALPDPNDVLRRIRGVGGVESVITRRVDRIDIGDRSLADVALQLSAVDYGFGINGILGFDLLARLGAIVDLDGMELRFARH